MAAAATAPAMTPPATALPIEDFFLSLIRLISWIEEGRNLNPPPSPQRRPEPPSVRSRTFLAPGLSSMKDCLVEHNVVEEAPPGWVDSNRGYAPPRGMDGPPPRAGGPLPVHPGGGLGAGRHDRGGDSRGGDPTPGDRRPRRVHRDHRAGRGGTVPPRGAPQGGAPDPPRRRSPGRRAILLSAPVPVHRPGPHRGHADPPGPTQRGPPPGVPAGPGPAVPVQPGIPAGPDAAAAAPANRRRSPPAGGLPAPRRNRRRSAGGPSPPDHPGPAPRSHQASGEPDPEGPRGRGPDPPGLPGDRGGRSPGPGADRRGLIPRPGRCSGPGPGPGSSP